MNRYKSGSQKRRERKQREKREKELKSRNVIAKFFKQSDAPKPNAPAEPEDVSSLSTCREELPLEDLRPADEEHGCATIGSGNETSATGTEVESAGLAAGLELGKANDNVDDFAENENKFCDYNDPGRWPEHLQDKDRQCIVLCKLKTERQLTDMIKDMPPDYTGKRFSKNLLSSQLSNCREELPRDWIVWSSSKQVLYCITCLLFSSGKSLEHHDSTSLLARREGVDPKKQQWRYLYERLRNHEKNPQHRDSYVAWKLLEKSVTGSSGVDSSFQQQIQTESEKFNALLRRILDVTLFLASRKVPFRGQSQDIGNHHNGNFLGLLELLSHYDPLLQHHLECVKDKKERGKRMRTHYLSWQTQNEFISLCGKHILDKIMSERKDAIYFSIICDATPDVSHTEQNVLILRYVHKNDENKWSIQERFVEFFPCNQKTGEEIAEALLSRLDEHGIDLADCRGQGFDNGSNMAGKVKGVQARILQKNDAALFSPCAAHTLNLVGVNAASCCRDAITFFGSVNRLYKLFSSCPERWNLLLEATECSLQILSDTRWSSRVDAVRPIAQKLPSIFRVLEKVISTEKYTNEIRSEARGLKTYFSSFTAVLMAAFWLKILTCINERNLILQSKAISLEIASRNIKDLSNDLQHLRENCHAIFTEAQLVSKELGIPTELKTARRRRKRPRRLRSDSDTSNDPEGVATVEESVEAKITREVLYLILDSVIAQMNHRFDVLDNICKLFNPVLNFRSLTSKEISSSCADLLVKYPRDLTSLLQDELLHLKHVYNATFNFKEASGSASASSDPLDLLNSLYSLGLEGIFSEVCIALRIFCCLPVSVAQGERSFSKLAVIKNYLRSTMSNERLNGLSMISIEHELASQINFNEVIRDFANMKIRRWSSSSQ